MSTTARAAAANRDRFPTQGKRDIGIGGSTLYMRYIAQVGVYGTYSLKDAGVAGQFSTRTVSNHYEFGAYSQGASRLRVVQWHGSGLIFDCGVQRQPQCTFYALDFRSRRRTD